MFLSHFTAEINEAMKSSVTCPGSQVVSSQVSVKPKVLDLRPGLHCTRLPSCSQIVELTKTLSPFLNKLHIPHFSGFISTLKIFFLKKKKLPIFLFTTTNSIRDFVKQDDGVKINVFQGKN